MKKPDLTKQLANRINQPHVIESWINKIEKAAYNKGYKDAESKQCTLYDAVPMLRKAHDMLEVEFSKQTQKDQEEMTKIVEMCEAIKDDYWMYKPRD